MAKEDKIDCETSDVTISCLGKEIVQGHKRILSASSPFLRRLYSVTSEISLTETPLQTVEDLFKFIYMSQVPTDKVRFNEFVILAKKLEVQGLPSVEPHEDQSDEPLEDQSDEPLKANQSKSNKRKRKSDEEQTAPKRFKKIAQEKSNSTEPKRKRRGSQSDTDAETDTEATENLIKQTEITDLPNEILLKILSHVQTSDLIKKVSLVSNRFNQLSKDHLAQVSVHLAGQYAANLGKKELIQFFNGKNKIQEVYVPSTMSQYNLVMFLEHAIVQQKLTTAIYTNSSLGDNAVVDLLARHPEKARQLQKLVLKNRLG